MCQRDLQGVEKAKCYYCKIPNVSSMWDLCCATFPLFSQSSWSFQLIVSTKYYHYREFSYIRCMMLEILIFLCTTHVHMGCTIVSIFVVSIYSHHQYLYFIYQSRLLKYIFTHVLRIFRFSCLGEYVRCSFLKKYKTHKWQQYIINKWAHEGKKTKLYLISKALPNFTIVK